MMKNKKLVIGLIVVLSIIVVILIMLFIALLNNGSLLKKYFKTDKISSEIILDKTMLNNNIEINTNNSDIDFKYSKDDNIKIIVYADKEDIIDVRENTDKMIVDFKDDTNKFFWFDNFKNKIEVYVPKEFDKDITINSNLGDIDILHLDNSNINIDSDCGDVDIGSAKSVVIESKLGDVSIGKITEYLDIKSDCGDIELDNVSLIKNSKIKSDLGDVEIDRIYDVNIDAQTDVGESKIRNNDRYSYITLTIKSDVGDININ